LSIVSLGIKITKFFKNTKWIKVNAQELYNFTMWIAQSPPGAKDETVKAIEKFLNKHVVNVSSAKEQFKQ